jgi:hypothetical protein
MKPWYRFLMYAFTLAWDLITWPLILLMRLFWGENLCWEREPKQGNWALTCDLKKDSWPCRTWYAYKIRRKKVLIHPNMKAKFGTYRTWAGTTLGPHAIFYGPGRRSPGIWGPVQEHEHRHCEQGEAGMVASFMYALPVFIYSMMYHNMLWIMALVMWTLGYVSMVANFFVAFLRGENLYEGSHHEEAAYDHGKVFKQYKIGEQHGR